MNLKNSVENRSNLKEGMHRTFVLEASKGGLASGVSQGSCVVCHTKPIEFPHESLGKVQFYHLMPGKP